MFLFVPGSDDTVKAQVVVAHTRCLGSALGSGNRNGSVWESLGTLGMSQVR